MNGLRYLFFIKIKAMIRNVYSRPLSAIITSLSLLFFIGMIGLSLYLGSHGIFSTNIKNVETFLMVFLAYILFFFGIMAFQKRTALVMQADANYIFAGPFTRKQTLAYLLIDTLKGCILYAFLTCIFLLASVVGLGVSFAFIVTAIISTFILYYILFSYITYFYLLDITHPRAKAMKSGFFILLLIIIAALAAHNVIALDFDMRAGLLAFFSDPKFYWVPVFGWLKLSLISVLTGNIGGFLLGISLNLAVCILFTVLVLTIKGDFCEQVLMDAEWITKLRKDAKEGKEPNSSFRKTMKTVNKASFSSGAYAIFSGNMLQMKKSGGWIKKKELLLLLLYIVIAKLSGYSYTGFQYFIMIVIFMSIATDSIVNELKMHYIYLIPDTAFNKLIALVSPIILRSVIITVLALVPSAFLFHASLAQTLTALLTTLSYSMIFIAGNIWSIRILKSRNNAAAEQFFKMFIVLLGCLPTFILIIIATFLLGFSNPILFSVVTWISVVTNLIVSILALIFAQGIFHGNNAMAD